MADVMEMPCCGDGGPCRAEYCTFSTHENIFTFSTHEGATTAEAVIVFFLLDLMFDVLINLVASGGRFGIAPNEYTKHALVTYNSTSPSFP